VERPVALVSGGNRGIGLAVCRQLAVHRFAVVLGSRDPDAGERAAAALAGDVRAQQLDVADQASVDQVARWLDSELGRLDVLVSNAGVYPSGRAAEMDMASAERTLQVNALGAWRLAVAVIPLMRRTGGGRIVNVSSEAGSLASMGAFMPAYNVSKAALNAVTRVLAADLRADGILVNSVCPGWVRTDMGGPSAPRSAEEGAASVVWAATLAGDGPTGGFFRDGRPLLW
jgi:NAD(P)-dependent dehydrogenase (short-subunit alcohol dehydrogenase family)